MIIIYCDASGAGGVAGTAVFKSHRKAGRLHLPDRLTDTAGIYEFEIASAIRAPRAALFLLPGHPILLCADNDGAAAALIRGNSENADRPGHRLNLLGRLRFLRRPNPGL